MKLFILIILFFFALNVIAEGSSRSIVPDTMTERVRACTICHQDGDHDQARSTYYPRIAGKLEGYLFNQLRHFRDGRRYHQPMALLLENMSDDYLQAIARHFSQLNVPYPSPESIDLKSNEIQLVEKLIRLGDPQRNIPACSACHGDTLMGNTPYIPGLLGLPSAYLTAQLSGWRSGSLIRGQVTNCMSEIAKQLSYDEIIAISKWLATQAVEGEAQKVLSPDLIKRCQSIFLEGVAQE